jgi:hypothetical protein
MLRYCRFCQQLSPGGLPPMGAEKKEKNLLGKTRRGRSEEKNAVVLERASCLFSPPVRLFISRVGFSPFFSLKHKKSPVTGVGRRISRHSVFLESGVAGRFHFPPGKKKRSLVSAPSS